MTSWNGRRARAVLLGLLFLTALPAHADRGAETVPAFNPQEIGTLVAPAPPDRGPQTVAAFKPQEIEALVAPIALYPDQVLAQVLMASTYPLEIVHAARWVKANPNVTGDAAIKAVANQPWDASVKSLVAFPQILEPMNDKIDWTQKLGDAFLAQQKDVLAAVQRLRARAHEAGNLTSNEQQNVIVEQPPVDDGQPIVKIEPANPEVIYIPAYNPAVVYGAWSYPAYPPYYWAPYPAYYPGAALATGFAWGIGLAAAGAIFSDCNWHGGDVYVDHHKVKNVDRNFDRNKAQGKGGRWQHDANHRNGVGYRDNATRDKFGGHVAGADRPSQYRGRTWEAGTDHGLGITDRAGNRATAADRGRAGNQAGVSNRGTRDLNRVSYDNRGGYSGGGRDRAFSGVGSGTVSQRNFDRGSPGMQASGFSQRSGGAGVRGGGGGFRGGRR